MGMGRGGLGGVEGEGEAEEEVSEVGRGRKKGREGVKQKKTTDKDNNDRTCQISNRKKTTPKKWDTCDVQEDTTLKVSPGPSHDLLRTRN